MSKIIGIDLGTTYSAIAQLDDLGNPEVLSSTDSNRKINQTIKNINLESSARQVDMGFSYRKDVSEDLAFSLKHLITNNLNHSSLSNRLHSSYVGMDYKDLKLGISSNPNDSSIEKQVSYVIAL